MKRIFESLLAILAVMVAIPCAAILSLFFPSEPEDSYESWNW